MNGLDERLSHQPTNITQQQQYLSQMMNQIELEIQVNKD